MQNKTVHLRSFATFLFSHLRDKNQLLVHPQCCFIRLVCKVILFTWHHVKTTEVSHGEHKHFGECVGDNRGTHSGDNVGNNYCKAFLRKLFEIKSQMSSKKK